jgi:DNA polymerase III delta prime subunit
MSWANEAIKKVEGLRIPHRNFELAKLDISSALLTMVPEEMLLIVGPTGVGKSLLAERLSPMILGAAGESDGKYAPVIKMSAMSGSVNGAFSTKDFALSALQAVRHPFYALEQEGWHDAKRLNLVDRTAQGVFRVALKNAFKELRTKFWVIDELQEIKHIPKGIVGGSAFMDSLKGSVVDTQVRLIVISTYEILRVLLKSTHLLRRKIQVHFPRYLSDKKEDVIAFDQILKVYSECIRFEGSRSLRDWNEYLYRGSLGCIGLLRPWLRDALRMAWISNSRSLQFSHLEARRRSASELSAIDSEILEGEKLLESDDELATVAETSLAKPSGRGAKRPFRRHPKRDRRGNEGEVR